MKGLDVWKNKLNKNRARDYFEEDVAQVKKNVETGAKTLGEGRAMVLVLELLLDIKEELVKINCRRPDNE